MNLRFPPKLKKDLEARVDLMKGAGHKVSIAEMIRRAITKYTRAIDSGKRVALGENEETATRENSTGITCNLGRFEGKILHRDVLRIVRWALDESPAEQQELSPQAKKDAEWLRKKREAMKRRPWRAL